MTNTNDLANEAQKVEKVKLDLEDLENAELLNADKYYINQIDLECHFYNHIIE